MEGLFSLQTVKQQHGGGAKSIFSFGLLTVTSETLYGMETLTISVC
jgi:hypothetical protein